MDHATRSVGTGTSAPARGGDVRVAVVHDGARLHYALPLALQQSGMLERVFTDWFVRPRSIEAAVSALVARFSPKVGRRMAARRCDELEPSRVRINPWQALYHPYARRRFTSDREYFMWCSARTADWVRRKGLAGASALMGFIRNIDPGLCAEAQRAGLITVADQMIAPAAIERAEAARQAERWPQWQDPPRLDEYNGTADVEARTWAALDHITCASDYVRSGLLSAGIDPARVTVIPYPIDADQYAFVDRRGRAGPVTVGFVGAVNLRKGAPYFLEVAKRFDPARVRFVMVGPVQIRPAARELLAASVQVVGSVPRSDVYRWLTKFDVYFFPSTCEGSAGSVMEAMATGLPVVTTPNSGTVVRDGLDGVVACYDNVNALAAAVERMVGEPEYRWAAGEAARQRVAEFSVDRYGRELAKLLNRLSEVKQGATWREIGTRPSNA